jgi:hypothetical protein
MPPAALPACQIVKQWIQTDPGKSKLRAFNAMLGQMLQDAQIHM